MLQSSLLLKTQSKEGLPSPPPMNASLLVEEMYRDVLNTFRQSSELVLLDAKAALDVVVHTHVEKTVSGRVR